MATFKIIFPFFIFPVIYASHDYPSSVCGDNGILIRFPFQLEGDQNPYCGYPGFKLSCTNENKTVLKLPYSGEFYVHDINYLEQQIQVIDPDECLPKRILSLNFSGSPFTAIFHRNYSFLSCPYQNAGSQFIPIECLSNSTNFISAIPSVKLADSLPESCYVSRSLSVPVARSGLLEETLTLTWDKPDCTNCEFQELMCGFESNNSSQVLCFPNHRTGKSQRVLVTLRTITLTIVGPAALCVIVIVCCMSYKDRIANAALQSSAQAAIVPHHAANAGSTGLDESIIESYEKLVLGESRRVPGPNDVSCWICLSEYNSKDIIRCIPECKHCFHVECIDKWLHMNTTCPVCRNPPSPSIVHVITSDP
ncbi:PREDICTED: putative RING-H2 finger protein ATL21A [Lupinus angustifolius]|uniref:putative RING-H2 finger protein ATL21A n=1 Tax=Lupinus angustifolius TaxID=3871 RepID=UPI00092E2172|nr:PREDICTED: putative RING-H2 finger protein ATL21A [Lupinus angustifolius]